MIAIMLYYWLDARYHRADNRQMLRDVGLIKSPWERLLDRLGKNRQQKRPARWCRP